MMWAAVMAAVIGPAMPATAATASVAAAWTRPLQSTPATNTAVPVMQPLPNGTLLVRNGTDMLAVDARGVTRWSMPNIDDALVAGRRVVFRRPHVVFAVRATDAGVLWKRACEKPAYLAAAGDRIVTTCGGLSTVLRARDGSVLARHPTRTFTGPPSIRGVRTLNVDYVMVTDVFSGGWMGEAITSRAQSSHRVSSTPSGGKVCKAVSKDSTTASSSFPKRTFRVTCGK